MNVLMVNTVPTRRNGITNVIINYIKAIDKSKFNIIGYVSISPIENSIQENLDAEGVSTYIVTHRISNPIKYIYELASIAKKYDILHAHGNSATLVLEMLAAKIAGIKLRIAHSHNTRCKSKTLHIILNPFFQSLCNKRLACGKDAGIWLFGSRDFIVLNNGIKCSNFSFNLNLRKKMRDQLNWDSEFIVGNVGNFNEQKNHTFLLSVFAEAIKSKPNLRLLILGDGEKRTQIEKQIQDLGIENNVCLKGNVTNVNEYLNAMDLIAMPSLFEGLPLSLVEQQANGLRCIVSNTITKEVDKTGLVSFIPLEKKVWVDSLSNVSDTDIDRILASQESLKKIKNWGYDIDTEVIKLENTYLNSICLV